jgi:hypothetical protein
VGLWSFDDPADLTAAEIGLSLQLTGTHEAVTGVDEPDGAARIDIGSHYVCEHGIAANGGGSLVNEYTFVYDLQTFGRGLWHCLLQTNQSNSNDGEVFIDLPGRVGVSATGYSWPRLLDAKTWYRLVLVVDNGSRYEIYVDGLRILEGTAQGIDGRFGLDPTCLLFADENGEDGELDISRVALYDVALSQAEVEALGGLGGLTVFVTPPYLQNLKADGISIMWETETPTPGVVEYGLDAGYGGSVTGVVEDSGNQTWIHTAVLTGLAPAMEHHFRVVLADTASVDFTFTTAPANETGFTFAVWSDSQGYNHGDYDRDPTQPSKAMFDHMVAEGIDFAVTCGDLAEDGNSYSDTRVFFVDRPIRRLAAEGVPFFTAWGNHDGGESAVLREFTDLPSKDAGPPFHGGYGSYSFDFGGCHFICIDYLREGADVPGWVEADLQSEAAQSARFIFLFVHRAPFYERWYDGEANLRTDLVPLLEQYGVNVCFSGHMHGYNRGLLNGVYYCVTGGASWLDHHEPLTTDWPHMTHGGYHDLAPDIEGGLIHEYVKVTVSSGQFTSELLTFHPDGSYREVLDNFAASDLTPVGDEQPAAGGLTLARPYPNPFNPRTWIDFVLDGEESAEVPARLAIYSNSGRQVRLLMDGPLRPGRHRLPWDGRDHHGDSLPSGVYLFELEAGTYRVKGKVTLLK